MNDLLGRIKGAGRGGDVLADSPFFKRSEYVTTEIPIINAAFSGKVDGGLVSGLTILAGASKSFKTLLALYCMKSYFNKYPDAIAIIYDSEFGITPQYLKSFGIDTSRILHVPIEHIEQLKFDMSKRLSEIKRGDRVFIMVDSLGGLASKKEIEDAADEKSVADMTRAKAIRSLLRIITPTLSSKDIPMLVINHVYQTMELYAKSVVGGGSSVMYSANQVFIITKAQEKDTSGVVGWNFTINIEKSRYVKEKSKLEFNVLYDRGINRWSGLLDLASESGHIEKVRARGYVYKRIDQTTGEVEATGYSEEQTNTAEFWTPVLNCPKFKAFVEKKYCIAYGDMLREESLQDEDDANEVFDNLDEE